MESQSKSTSSATILPSPAVISSESVTKDSKIREKTSPGQTLAVASVEKIFPRETLPSEKQEKQQQLKQQGEEDEDEQDEIEEETEDLDDELQVEESEDEMHVDHSHQSIKGQTCDEQDHLTIVKEARREEKVKTALETSGELLNAIDK